jgi:hypothetical protein
MLLLVAVSPRLSPGQAERSTLPRNNTVAGIHHSFHDCHIELSLRGSFTTVMSTIR